MMPIPAVEDRDEKMAYKYKKVEIKKIKNGKRIVFFKFT